jgi:hypothetical protein
MKKRMKQTGALLLTLAMILSLSVTAFATVVGTPGNSDTNTVTSEGPPPADLTTVVLPTAASNQFNMYFDTFGMILETEGDRYASLNSNKGIEEIEDSRFYFLNNVTTGADLTDALAVDFGTGDTLVKAGTKVVKYTKAATGGLTKIYAKPDTYGETYSWVKVSSNNAVDTADADWAASGAYEKIASLKSLDPKSGAGLDAIAALNKSDPDLYLTVGATALDSSAANAAGSADLVGCFEYTFVAGYSDYATTPADTCFVLFKDDGTVDKVFATKGTAANGGNAAVAPTEATSPTFADFTDSTDSDNDVKDAFLTVSSAVYYRQRESRAVFSLKKTSVPLKIINKTNADLGVSVSAELTGIPGGDGTSNTYVYAKGYDSATGKFYDAALSESTKKVIQGGTDGVPVFYLALTDGTDSEAMTYADSKGTVSIGAMLAGRPDLFKKAWDTTLNSGAGGYAYVSNDPATRESDFSSKEFYFEGAIDGDNPAWNTLGSSPNAKVTWKLETITPPAAPTVTPPTTITSKNNAVFTISNNTDNLVFVSATQGGTEITADKITVANDATTGATTGVTFVKGTITGTADVVLTFKDQQKAFRTKDVTVSFG